MTVVNYKTSVASTLRENLPDLRAISEFIYDNPEEGFHEFKAHDLLTKKLKKNGFTLEYFDTLPTAFKATFGHQEGPIIAVNCEYDCLPGGHLCGHNLIAAIGIGIGLCLKTVISQHGFGKVVIMGTPAEEGGGGKQLLLDLGAYKGIDACLMAHGGINDQSYYKSLATTKLKVEYDGKAAHAAASPWEGINALDAAVITYTAISTLRQQILPTDRIHAIISDGGKAANVIPSHSEMEFTVRGLTRARVDELVVKMEAIINGAALSTGCKQKTVVVTRYDDMKVVNTLCDTLSEELNDLGVLDLKHIPAAGSTDQGNVSKVIPSIHPKFKINSSGNIHTKEFGKAAGLPESFDKAMVYAEAIARLGARLLLDSDYLEKVKRDFKSGK